MRAFLLIIMIHLRRGGPGRGRDGNGRAWEARSEEREGEREEGGGREKERPEYEQTDNAGIDQDKQTDHAEASSRIILVQESLAGGSVGAGHTKQAVSAAGVG